MISAQESSSYFANVSSPLETLVTAKVNVVYSSYSKAVSLVLELTSVCSYWEHFLSPDENYLINLLRFPPNSFMPLSLESPRLL